MIRDDLIDIFKKMPTELKPDAVNEYQNYSYNSVKQIKKLLAKALKEKGILFVPSVISVENVVISGENPKVLTTADFLFRFIKGDEEFTVKTFGQGIDNQGKGLSKAKSDALKRLVTDMFLISSGDEDDEKEYGSEKTHKEEYPKKPYNTNYSGYNDTKISDKQMNFIWYLANEKGVPEDILHERIKVDFNKEHLSDLTKQEASKLIDALQKEG